MTSTASQRLRLDKQATGDNPDAWGDRLNGVIDLVDEAFGFAEIAVNGNVTLSTQNFVSDQSRRMVLRFTGAGGFAVTIPAVEKMYYIDNRCAADVVLKTASTAGSTVLAGTKRIAYCDGANVNTDTSATSPSATDTAFNPTPSLPATNVQSALAALDARSPDIGAIAGLRNRLRNGNFRVNQRLYVSGTSVAAGAFVHDRWKAGSGGLSYTFATGSGDTLITVTAGSIFQTVDGDVIGDDGKFVLSWSGTSTARIGINGAAPSGSYGASPIRVSGVNPGQVVSVEFGTGTLTKTQLEPGTVVTPFERRSEEPLCLEYAWRTAGNSPLGIGFAISTSSVAVIISHPVRMRSIPTAIFNSVTATDSSLNTQTMNSISFQLSSRDNYQVTFSGPSSFSFGQGSIVATASTGSAFFSCDT